MQQPTAVFQTICKQGKLHIENGTIFVKAIFIGIVWSIPISHIIAVTSASTGFMTAEVNVYTAQGLQKIETLNKKKAAELVAFLNSPQVLPIDMEMQRTKFEIEQRRLSLREINTTMSSQRSRYQQSHVNGFIGQMQRSDKNAHLRKNQPMKEKLQQEKLLLERHLNQLQLLKSQGVSSAFPLAL